VLEHLAKEEQVLFPAILAGRGRLVAGPISVMESEHDDHAADLRETRRLTADLVAPAEACTSWRALYLRLGGVRGGADGPHPPREQRALPPRAGGLRGEPP
jgi:regulator of cell morphogenesis and NO signaling